VKQIKITTMTKSVYLILLLFIVFGCDKEESANNAENIPNIKEKYMGQEVPGLTPRIFAPDIISTGMSEINSVYSPDYKEFYYSVIMPNKQYVIMEMRYDGSKWTKPEVADFSGKYSDADPFITNDGKWLYFISKRPIDSSKNNKKDWDIWKLVRENDKWGNPQRLDSRINSSADDLYPTLSKQGNLYFSSGRKGSIGGRDIFCAKKDVNGFSDVYRLNDSINRNWEGDVFIAPNEEYLIFVSFGRPQGNGLYISFNENGKWSNPKRMGKEINVTGREFCPMVSPDGKYFFYTSAQINEQKASFEKLTYKNIKEKFIESYNHPGMGKNDIYWMDAKIIEKYKTQVMQ